MTGIDVKSLPEVEVMGDYISIHGSFLKSPKEQGSFSIYIREKGDKRTVEVEERIKQVLEDELGKDSTITKCAEDMPEDCIPLYDLILKPIDNSKPRKEEKPVIKTDQWGQPKEDGKDKEIKIEDIDKAEKIDISKPFAGEHSARLQEPGKYDKFRRTKGGKIYFKITIPAAIGIIWGHPKGKAPAIWIPQALRFPKDKYTAAQAKKFLTDNKIAYIKFEPAKKGSEKKKEEKQKKLEKDYFKFEKVDKKQQIVGGIIYEPNVEDTQGDYMEKADIEKMAYKYMLGDKKFKINHKGKDYNFPIIESYIPDENTKKGGQTILKGAWWLMVKVDNKKIWDDIESGKLGGFSMGGQAVKE